MQPLLRIRAFAVMGIARTAHGTALLRHALAAGLRPRCALISAETDSQLERSRPLWGDRHWWKHTPHGSPLTLGRFRAWRERLKRQKRIAAVPSSDSPHSTELEARLQLAGIPYAFVPGLGGHDACSLLRWAEVDAVLLTESPILEGEILTVCPGGIINIHAAPLPEYRGNYATHWALYHDDPLYVTAHIVDEGVDTGPILARRPLPVLRGDTLSAIDVRAYEECGRVAAQVLRDAMDRGVTPRPQAPWQGRAFTGRMPPNIVEELERRLKSDEYSHYAD